MDPSCAWRKPTRRRRRRRRLQTKRNTRGVLDVWLGETGSDTTVKPRLSEVRQKKERHMECGWVVVLVWPNIRHDGWTHTKHQMPLMPTPLGHAQVAGHLNQINRWNDQPLNPYNFSPRTSLRISGSPDRLPTFKKTSFYISDDLQSG